MAPKAMHLKIVAQDKLMGPLPLEKLVAMAAEGLISPEDLVRPGGARVWLPVTEIPELAAQLGPPRTAEPPPPPIVTPPPVVEPPRTIAEDYAEGDDEEDDELDADESDEPRTGLRPGRRRLLEEAAMDMAPMIDVTFLLLIFFMLTNSLANPTAIDVPAAVHGRGVTLEGQQLILVDELGRYYLGDTANEQSATDSLDALVEEVARNARQATGRLEVIVSAHRDVRHRQVRELVEGLTPIENLGPILLGVEEKLN